MRKSIASVSAVLALLACQSDKPEDQVRKAFEVCRAAVEAGDAATATVALSPAFRGPEGMDKATARLFLQGTFRQEKVGVTLLRNEVSVKGGEALQEVDLVLTGRSGGLLPQEASHRSLQLRWRKSGRDWLLLEVQPLDGR
jgi:ketosteroid isomerase-like protein